MRRAEDGSEGDESKDRFKSAEHDHSLRPKGLGGDGGRKP
jgi:hypothetical protein